MESGPLFIVKLLPEHIIFLLLIEHIESKMLSSSSLILHLQSRPNPGLDKKSIYIARSATTSLTGKAKQTISRTANLEIKSEKPHFNYDRLTWQLLTRFCKHNKQYQQYSIVIINRYQQ
jgi:hypothetical protein